MPINGLLVTLSADPDKAESVRAQLSDRKEILLGETQDRWQPIAVETSGPKDAHDFHEWLEAQPGVERVDVIYVGFDEPIPTATAP